MAQDLRKVNDIESLMTYFSENLGWAIDPDDYYDIDDITYDFDASDLGLKEEAFAKISSLKQLRPLVDEQRWGIFFVNFESNRFEVSALRKILSGLIPARRNADHAVWDKKDLLFLCTWGERNKVTIGAAHFEDAEKGLPQIKMISCEPAAEDFTQINIFEQRLAKLAWPSNPSDIAAWHEAWASAFTTRYRQTIQDSHTLTIRLAEEAQNIRDRILSTMEIETSNGYVHLLFEKFRATLVHDMTEQQFADMYAQTVVYGLFSARCMDESQEDFNASEAVECIPNTNPFLKGLLQECLGSNSAKSKLSFDELEVGNIVDLLLHTKTDSIITDFNRQTGGGREDPVIHFYEEFLSEYDKTQRVQRGVYYTPQPVVNFIVRAVDDILKHEFDVQDGLASTEIKKIKYKRESKKRRDGYFKTMVEDEMEVPAIQILDPATGTGTFLRQTILQIYANFCDAKKSMPQAQIQAEWNAYVSEHLLPRLNGFELMMAPYAVAHMKLAMILKDTGYQFDSNERLHVYLTNSLEEPGNSDPQFNLFDDPLAYESISANGVKKNTGINVVIGNPPYAGESSNKGTWIIKLLEDYKVEPGGKTKLQERNSKWLSDDYVKFIRYAQYFIHRSNYGIMAYICPHGFLDNPTFRGMRWNLLMEYDNIIILNLHGNTKKHETTPDGGKDENVFDIMQGVCIILAIKTKKKSSTYAEVLYHDCYGLRNEKYDYLNKTSITNIPFIKVNLRSPALYFIPKDYSLKDDYDKGISVQDLFGLQTAGMVTSRDTLTLHEDPETAYQVATDFMSLPAENARNKYALGKDVQDWKVEWAQQDLKENTISGKLDPSKICKVSYRCFDSRYSYYTGKSRGFYCRPRKEVMQFMVNTDNIGFVTVNRQPEQTPIGYYFIADGPVSNGYIRSDSVSIDTLFPLYTYYENMGKTIKQVNFQPGALKMIANATGLIYSETESCETSNYFSPIDVMGYLYGILYSPNYRQKYSVYLKLEYPKIPLPDDAEMFKNFSTLGKQLINLHLMKDTEKLSDSKSKYPFCGEGDCAVEKTPASAYKNNRIYINKKQYFDNVPSTLWEFYIGGYQPLQKWLKDRRKTSLSHAQISHYSHIIWTLEQTVLIMQKIDNIKQF